MAAEVEEVGVAADAVGAFEVEDVLPEGGEGFFDFALGGGVAPAGVAPANPQR